LVFELDKRSEIVKEQEEMSGAIRSTIMDIFLLRANDDLDINVVSAATKLVEMSLGISFFRIGRDFDFAKLSDTRIRLLGTYVVSLFSMNFFCKAKSSSFIDDSLLSSMASLLKEVLFFTR